MEAARPATHDDLPRLVELHARALAAMVDQRGGSLFSRREARAEPGDGLAALIDGDRGIVVAGTIDDVIVGFGSVTIERLRDGSTHAVIDELYVEEGARGVGVGEAVAAELVGWARAQGAAGIDAYALPGDRSTKNFFEASGFTARLLVMHHRLADA